MQQIWKALNIRSEQNLQTKIGGQDRSLHTQPQRKEHTESRPAGDNPCKCKKYGKNSKLYFKFPDNSQSRTQQANGEPGRRISGRQRGGPGITS